MNEKELTLEEAVKGLISMASTSRNGKTFLFSVVKLLMKQHEEISNLKNK